MTANAVRAAVGVWAGDDHDAVDELLTPVVQPGEVTDIGVGDDGIEFDFYSSEWASDALLAGTTSGREPAYRRLRDASFAGSLFESL